MPPPAAALRALARKYRIRALVDVALAVSITLVIAVCLHFADAAAVRRVPPPPPALTAADSQPARSGPDSLPSDDEGMPVIEPVTEPESEPTPQNDLQKRVAAIREKLGDVTAGKVVEETVYLPLSAALPMAGGEFRWDSAERTGVLISDSGLMRFMADTSRVSIDEQPLRLAAPVRTLTDEPWVPVGALGTLFGAQVDEDGDSGSVKAALEDVAVTVLVPERLFSIEIARGERWLKVRYAGELAKEYPICAGKGNNTPVGHFHIRNKAVWPSWRAYWGELIPGGSRRNPLGARWLGTSARGRSTGWSIGIHGTNQPSSIGRRISGGCIRTYNHHSIELYETIPIGTPVWIHE